MSMAIARNPKKTVAVKIATNIVACPSSSLIVFIVLSKSPGPGRMRLSKTFAILPGITGRGLCNTACSGVILFAGNSCCGRGEGAVDSRGQRAEYGYCTNGKQRGKQGILDQILAVFVVQQFLHLDVKLHHRVVHFDLSKKIEFPAIAWGFALTIAS